MAPILVIPVLAQETEDNLIPTWIKDVMNLWIIGSVDDEQFIQILEFLIDSNIIELGNNVIVSEQEISWEEKYNQLKNKVDEKNKRGGEELRLFKEELRESFEERTTEAEEKVVVAEEKVVVAEEKIKEFQRILAEYGYSELPQAMVGGKTVYQIKYDMLQTSYDNLKKQYDELLESTK